MKIIITTHPKFKIEFKKTTRIPEKTRRRIYFNEIVYQNKKDSKLIDNILSNKSNGKNSIINEAFCTVEKYNIDEMNGLDGSKPYKPTKKYEKFLEPIYKRWVEAHMVKKDFPLYIWDLIDNYEAEQM